MNIAIPKKFDSKAAIREFFYSRDFILTLKIKMNLLLHRAILEGNRIPLSVVETGNPAAANAKATTNPPTNTTSPTKHPTI